MAKLSKALDEVDRKVAGLRDRYVTLHLESWGVSSELPMSGQVRPSL